MADYTMKVKYTVAEVGRMRLIAGDLNLIAHDDFWTMPVEELARIANGCGPDSWPDWMRERAGRFADFPLATLLHDVAFDRSNGQKKEWALANWAYGQNAMTETNYRYPFQWSWERFMKRLELNSHRKIAVKALEAGSWGAWVEAARKREKQEIAL